MVFTQAATGSGTIKSEDRVKKDFWEARDGWVARGARNKHITYCCCGVGTVEPHALDLRGSIP